jgi:dephospho-CoA kinase
VPFFIFAQDISMNIFDPYHYLLEQDVSERVVTFDKQAFPKKGHIVVTAGGPGVGKGFVISNIIPIVGKYLNVDSFIETLAKRRNIDLNDPKQTSDLYAELKPQHKKLVANFVHQLTSKNKDNIILDKTGKSLGTEVVPLIPMFKRLGYQVTLVYVHTDRSVAWQRNLKRSRTLAKDVFDEIHDKIESAVKQNERYFDHVWYVDNSLSEPDYWVKYPELIQKVK